MNQSKIVILPVPSQSANTPGQIILALRNAGIEDPKIEVQILDGIANIEELYEVSQQIIQAGKFLVSLGDNPAITLSLAKAQLEKWPSMKVLKIDAQVIQQSDQDPEWFAKVVDDLPEHVYVSINIDEINQDQSRHIIDLTRELTHRRNVLGLDLIAPALQDDKALFCAKLLYKILGFISQR